MPAKIASTLDSHEPSAMDIKRQDTNELISIVCHYLRRLTRLFRFIAGNNATYNSYSRFELIVMQLVTLSLHRDVLKTVYRQRTGQEKTTRKQGLLWSVPRHQKLWEVFANQICSTRWDDITSSPRVNSHCFTVIWLSNHVARLAIDLLCPRIMAMRSKAKVIVLLEEEEEIKKCTIGLILHERIRPLTNYSKYCRWRVTEWIENRIMQVIRNCEYQVISEHHMGLREVRW